VVVDQHDVKPGWQARRNRPLERRLASNRQIDRLHAVVCGKDSLFLAQELNVGCVELRQWEPGTYVVGSIGTLFLLVREGRDCLRMWNNNGSDGPLICE